MKTKKKNRTKTETITKHVFWMDWGTFYGSTMVCCNFKDYADLKELLKRKKFKDWHEAVDLKPSEHSGSHHFGTWTVEDTRTKDQRKYSILWLKHWKPDMEHYKILAHELVHAIHFCMPDFLDFMEEKEAVAYQHSYLFEKAATELNKIYK